MMCCSIQLSDIELIAVDADDTLWETQPYFDRVEESYCKLLSDYAPLEECRERLFERECYNMKALGYGSKAYIISMVESAIAISNSTISNSKLKEIIELGRSLIDIPATPLDGVATTLKALRTKISERYINSTANIRRTKVIIFTKGDIKEQELKIYRSELLNYFDSYRVYSDKRCEDYIRLLKEFDVASEKFLMIGNSFKSDIEPVVKIGSRALHIPFYAPWRYESMEEYEHNNITKLSKFSDILQIIHS